MGQKEVGVKKSDFTRSFGLVNKINTQQMMEMTIRDCTHTQKRSKPKEKRKIIREKVETILSR